MFSYDVFPQLLSELSEMCSSLDLDSELDFTSVGRKMYFKNPTCSKAVSDSKQMD